MGRDAHRQYCGGGCQDQKSYISQELDAWRGFQTIPAAFDFAT